MKTTIDRHDFNHAFQRAAHADNFSSQGLRLLFDYFEECDPDMELDVIAICCEYVEDSVADIARNYSIDLNDADPEADDYDDQCKEIVRDYLNDNTSVVGETADGFVYAIF